MSDTIDRTDTLGDRALANDPYAIVESGSELLLERVREAIAGDETDRISDRAAVDLMTAAIKLYAAKAAPERDPAACSGLAARPVG